MFLLLHPHPQLLESSSSSVSSLALLFPLPQIPALPVVFLLKHGLSLLLIKQQINLTINAVINANNAYNITKTRKLSSKAVKATIKNIAKKVAATNNGDCKSFCNTIAKLLLQPEKQRISTNYS